MEPMDRKRIEERLAGPHQAILSISRTDRGPHAIPMSYVFDGTRFAMITSPTSLHGRLLEGTGRATVTVHDTVVRERSVHHWYVIAEGPIGFSDDDPGPLMPVILAKDRPGPHVDAWVAQMGRDDDRVVVLVPERLSGYESVSRLR